MKKTLLLLLSLSFLASTISCGVKPVELTVQNSSDFDRSSELIEVSIDVLSNKLKLSEGKTFIVKTSAGEEVPSQVTSDGKLLFQSGAKAGETVSYSISVGKAAEYETKTYGRLITERMDDFAWENDLVAFRAYHQKLMGKDGPSNGFDVWYKRTNKMVIDRWYGDDVAGVASYHNDNGEGQDDYKVGRSLGAGAMAPYVDGKLWLGENFIGHEILDNGPLRTTFKLTYNNLDVNGRSISETRTISIDAGSQLSKVTQEFGTSEPMEVAAGIAKRVNDDYISSSSYIIYAEPYSDVVHDVFLAVVLPNGIKSTKIDSYESPIIRGKNVGKYDTYSHILAISDYTPGTPMVYYTGFGWSKFGFETVESFRKYIDNFVTSLETPLFVVLVGV